ncbi:MAG: maleylpyruvate isomerase family mycothiol-dependent enzyme [Ilumatobacteraceae bacterium]
MDLNGYLAVLASEARALAAAAEEAGLDAPVPTCPGWTVNDLVLHVGEVHRWATAAVANKATKLGDVPPDSRGPLPGPADTVDWFCQGAVTLRDTLVAADPCVEYAAFLTDPVQPSLLFWARRQTFETTVHRVDAESAVSRCAALAPDVAIDGIDEFLTGFLPRSRTPLRADAPHCLQIAPDYSDQRWTVSISGEMPETVRRAADADCTVSGPASDIYLALWNRAPLDNLQIDGDRAAIDLLRQNVQIRWG